MKLLFLLTNFPGFGGIEKVTDYICSYLASKGFDITVLAFGTNQPALVEKVSGRFNLMFMPEAQGYTSKANTDYLKGVLTSNDFDFVVLQDSYAPMEDNFRKIDYPWKEKLVVVEHNDPMYIIRGLSLNTGNLKTDLLNLLRRIKRQYKNHERHSLLRSVCRRYVLLSESYRKSLKLLTCDFWGGQSVDIQIINNPLTISRPSSTSYQKKKQILFVGRFNYQKGLNFLLPIWEQFSKNNIDNWELVLLGEGEEKPYAESYIREHHLRNIRIDSPTTEVARYYEESAVLMMTSVFEGFPLVLAEAMSRGCVPIAFDSFSSIHDIIKSNENGILVTPFNIAEYVTKLSDLVRNNEQLLNLAHNARQTVERFGLDRIGSQWIEMFYNLSQRSQ